jgi:hypothetical protein
MAYNIFPPVALLIYNNGLSSLLDDKWLFSKLPEILNSMILRGEVPRGLFNKPIANGLLYLLGRRFFNQLFAITGDVLFCNPETAITNSSMIFYLLNGSGVKDSEAILNLILAIDEVDEILTETPQNRWNSAFHRQGIHFRLHDALTYMEEKHESEIRELRDIYAKNYAEKAFHDRQLCEYITYALEKSYGGQGYPVERDGDLNFIRIRRSKWPAWIMPTLLARERNICANCGVSFSELHREAHIDHIVPIGRGGCNDLINLQLLCSVCNLDKLNNFRLVTSSVPKYFSKLRKREFD